MTSPLEQINSLLAPKSSRVTFYRSALGQLFQAGCQDIHKLRLQNIYAAKKLKIHHQPDSPFLKIQCRNEDETKATNRLFLEAATIFPWIAEIEWHDTHFYIRCHPMVDTHGEQ